MGIFTELIVSFGMEECADLLVNRDWDPVYLASIFDIEFEDFSELWDNSMDEYQLLQAVDRYAPVVEDISMEDFV